MPATGNMPVLYANVVYYLQSDEAKAAFLWAADGPDKSRMKFEAERYANEVDRLAPTLETMIGAASAYRPLGRGKEASLRRFALGRHANQFWGGNVKPEFLRAE